LISSACGIEGAADRADVSAYNFVLFPVGGALCWYLLMKLLIFFDGTADLIVLPVLMLIVFFNVSVV